MIQIKPHKLNFFCPVCQKKVLVKDITWQGIHVLANISCQSCTKSFFATLPAGHAYYHPYIIDAETFDIYGDKKDSAYEWLAKPLAKSIQHPQNSPVKFEVSKKTSQKDVYIINCIDYLYGHSLLKLLNVSSYLKKNTRSAVIVIIPKFLEWLVPQAVDEIWKVSIPLSTARDYFPDLNAKINSQLKRFNKVMLSEAFAHPAIQDISFFTGVKPYSFNQKTSRVTFIWREDRPWFFQFHIGFLARKLKLIKPFLWWQNFKIIWVFSRLRKKHPEIKYTVAGLGQTTSFPDWIEDKRVASFTSEKEKLTCQIYAESRLVIGVHGSNLLLPSAHAGMTMCIIPSDRVGNMAQDIIYYVPQELADHRVTALRYRYLPITTALSDIYKIAHSMLNDFIRAKKYFTNK